MLTAAAPQAATPSVSVIIPAYNATSSLGTALESLRAQEVTDWEAIIIDDGSTDGTGDLARSFANGDDRFSVIVQANGGVSRARNAGLTTAAGDLVLFLDADDLLGDGQLGALLAHRRDTRSDIAYCGYREQSATGQLSDTIYAADLATRPYAALSHHCCLAIHTALAPRAAIKTAGGFDPDLATCEDWDLWIRLARAGATFAGIATALALYRQAPDSLSRRGSRSFVDGLRVLENARRPNLRLGLAAHEGRRDQVAVPHHLAVAHHVHWHAARAVFDGAPTEFYTEHLIPGDLNEEDAQSLALGSAYALLSHADYRKVEVQRLWERHRPGIDGLIASYVAALRLPARRDIMVWIDAAVDKMGSAGEEKENRQTATAPSAMMDSADPMKLPLRLDHGRTTTNRC